MSVDSPRTALIVGASGLVGGHCLRLLLDTPAYTSVVSLGRRQLPEQHAKLRQEVVDFDRAGEQPQLFTADDVFCCLGTTMRQAGGKEAFRRVDHGYVAVTALLAHRQGARRFLMISSMGADPGSLLFYPRVKGEAEAQLATLGYEALHLFRPASLTGHRDDPRTGEKVSLALLEWLAPLLRGPLRAYRPVAAATVARAMVHAALTATSQAAVRVHTSDEIAALGQP